MGGMVNSNTLSPFVANAGALEAELAWFATVLEARVKQHLDHDSSETINQTAPPDMSPGESMYANFVDHYQMGIEERLTIVLALAPHIRPQLLDIFFKQHDRLSRGYSEFGGIHGRMHGGFLPTAETALFLLAGTDLAKRFECQRLFDRDHFFAQHGILKLDPAPAGEPRFSGQLVLASEIIDLLTTGEVRKPDFSRDFPAKLITSEMQWEDLVLSPTTREQLCELEAWVEHEAALMNDWELALRLRPGYKCLFYGPPGTGKTLTATLLGKKVGRDVYRIALSTVVSKYIGETEKNLERIFSLTEKMNYILFFDEADALFGKRTNVSDAHDRYANQEVSYLLQRIEDFSGVVILASNFDSNMDEAFMRRFQAVVHFPLPNASEREQIWGASLSAHSKLDDQTHLDEIADKYELSGGAIMNVIRYASLMTLNRGADVIQHQDLIDGIRRELQKDGKTL
jgi:hypothetical protein